MIEQAKPDPQEAARQFKIILEENKPSLQKILEAYQLFQNSVALWTESGYVVYSLVEEAAEFQAATKLTKKMFRGDEVEFDFPAVWKELGDVWFFLFANATLWGTSIPDIMQRNVEKLADRASRGVIKGSGDDR